MPNDNFRKAQMMKLQRSMPVLQVSDVVASAKFYEKLGFRYDRLWGEPPMFCIVQRDMVTLALDGSRDGDVPLNQWWAAYLYVDDVDALHAEWTDQKAAEVTDIGDREYGCRDFDLIDIDGHRLAFGQDISDVTRPGLRKT